MIFQKAVLAQTNEIMELIEEAKAFFRTCHVDQWQDGYPAKEDIVRDIQNKDGYILQDGSEIIGYCCIDFDKEPAYDTLKEGKWLNDEPYVVIHRMAVANRCKGKGLAKQLFAHAEAFAKEHGVYNIRVDTDEENAIMKHIIISLGFVYCGGIWFANSDKIAFQKVLDQ